MNKIGDKLIFPVPDKIVGPNTKEFIQAAKDILHID